MKSPSFPLPTPFSFEISLLSLLGGREGEGLSAESPRRLLDDSNTVNAVFCCHRELGLGCHIQVQGQVLLLAVLGNFGQVTHHMTLSPVKWK